MSNDQNVQKNESTTITEDGKLIITRTFDAPRELVFRVCSEIEHLQHWWGPVGLTWGQATLDFRPGGKFHYSMSSNDGYTLWGRFVYEEIDAPNRIVYINSFSDEEGNAVRPPFSSEFPIEVRNEVTFEDFDGGTRITLTGGP
ncbi:SRPBCC domain-containing protein, partial [Paenibacillus kobensis]|uniref:SRPBCC domain-containing protein n=1 Tax=Paenibacillus kobensis TaxID=59841 RepID=UPI0013E37827